MSSSIEIDYIEDKLNGCREIRNEHLLKEDNLEFNKKRADAFHHTVCELRDLIEEATDLDRYELDDESIMRKETAMEKSIQQQV